MTKKDRDRMIRSEIDEAISKGTRRADAIKTTLDKYKIVNENERIRIIKSRIVIKRIRLSHSSYLQESTRKIPRRSSTKAEGK